MAMIVQHNLTAMNTNRQLGVTTGALAKSTEKLSSGYRINRAGDDAAGLTISEKMRSQIRGLDKASTNAEDGISLIQSAEGALNEAHAILQRMNELAVQGANDTNESIDRDAINAELDQLVTELDRISETTQFNKQNLLDGTFSNKNLQVGANVGQKITISIGAMDAKTIGLAETTQNTYNLSAFDVKGAATASAAAAEAKANIKEKVSETASGGFVYSTATTSYSTIDKAVSAKFNNATASTVSTKFQAKVNNYEMANSTIAKVQAAINNVSTQRSTLGALQNRLEHTVANLDTVSENTSSAESRIRDVDMASEMVNYSKNNILAQAGQAMLAQANQSTQGVLTLLG